MSITVSFSKTAFQKQRLHHQMYRSKGSYIGRSIRKFHSLYNFTSNDRKRLCFPNITFEKLKTMGSVQNNKHVYCNMPLWKAFSQYHFHQSLYFHKLVKFNKLTVQQLSPNLIISFLKVYKYWCIAPLYIHYFSSNWQICKILFYLWQ